MHKLKLPQDSFFVNLQLEDDILSFGKPSREAALKYVKNFNSAIDIGAHVGISVIHFSEYFRKVYAFEPNKTHFECLEENTAHLVNVEYYNTAISNENSIKTATYRTTKNSGSFQLLDESYEQPNKKQPRSLFTVESKKLDDYNFSDVGLIKIDVEGWEFEVLKGAKETILKSNPVLMIEFTGGESRKSLHRYIVDEYLSFIKEINYIKVDSIGDDTIYIKG